jgi:predicted metal-dependent hydrolase
MTMTGTTAFEYELNESARAKHLSISVHPDGRVVVTKPVRVSQAKVEVFAQSRAAWVQSALEAFARKRVRHEKERAKLGMSAVEKLPKLRRGTKAYKDAVAAARALLLVPLCGSRTSTSTITTRTAPSPSVTRRRAGEVVRQKGI